MYIDGSVIPASEAGIFPEAKWRVDDPRCSGGTWFLMSGGVDTKSSGVRAVIFYPVNNLLALSSSTKELMILAVMIVPASVLVGQQLTWNLLLLE